VSSNEPTPLPDPGGVQAAVDRYRDLARYLVAILAAVGATLVAGTQLSSVGELSWSREPVRVIAVGVGFLLAIGAVAWIVSRALDVLRPIEMSLEDVRSSPELEADVKRLRMLGGLGSVQELQAMINAPGQTTAQRREWQETGQTVVGRASYKVARQRFEGAWRGMQVGSLIGIVGIIAFAWGSNPPAESETSDSPPTEVAIALTHAGHRFFQEASGDSCGTSVLQGLMIGGTLDNPEVVTLPSHGCKAIRVIVRPEIGQALPLHMESHLQQQRGQGR
jgi:hypothetical protein